MPNDKDDVLAPEAIAAHLAALPGWTEADGWITLLGQALGRVGGEPHLDPGIGGGEVRVVPGRLGEP
jgi:hypothetical protein